MAHQSMSLYIERIKNRFPQYFKNVIIVDFGSLDINGNNRKYFEESQYTGVDLGIGNNVDVISIGQLRILLI